MRLFKSKILFISLILILAFSLQAVAALDGDSINQDDNQLSIGVDNEINEIKDYSCNDNVLSAGSEDCISINGESNSNASGNLVLEKNNDLAMNFNGEKLSGSDDGQDESGSDIDFNHHTVIDFVFGENTTISSEIYRPAGVWSSSYYETPQNPWLMNDTTWAYCIDGNSRDVDGMGYFPGSYHRITLTDSDKFINTITGEDVLPYLRTFIYLNFDDEGKFLGRGSFGTVTLPGPVFYSFMHMDYRNPDSIYNRGTWGSKTIYDYVKEVMDIVDSGNGVNSSGSFRDSDILSYQFYLFAPVSELNGDCPISPLLFS